MQRGRRALQRRLPATGATPTRCSRWSASKAARTRDAKDLSGGQRRRLDLALGIAGDPELIFLDEPTTGFDPAARRQSWELIASLRELGKTILLTTHYMDEAQHLADRVVVLANGRVIADADPDQLGGEVSVISPSTCPPRSMPLPDGRGRQRRHRPLHAPTRPTRDLAPLLSWATEQRHRARSASPSPAQPSKTSTWS